MSDILVIGKPLDRIDGRRKVTGGVALLVLVALAAAAGSLAGLMLVYSVDLPQIADLERYRPLTTTELYDVHGQLFGSFALERRNGRAAVVVHSPCTTATSSSAIPTVIPVKLRSSRNPTQSLGQIGRAQYRNPAAAPRSDRSSGVG